MQMRLHKVASHAASCFSSQFQFGAVFLPVCHFQRYHFDTCWDLRVAYPSKCVSIFEIFENQELDPVPGYGLWPTSLHHIISRLVVLC